MRLKWKHFHLSFAAVWVLALVFIACQMALRGNDTSRAGKQWGTSEKAERVLILELGQLRKQIEWKASRGYVEQKIRSMGLPLHKPHNHSPRELLARQP